MSSAVKRHITASKGGRTERFYSRITPTDKASITAMLAELKLTFGDWLAQIANEYRHNGAAHQPRHESEETK